MRLHRKDAKGAKENPASKPLYLALRSLRLCGSILFLLAGCATERIPSYPAMPADQALKVLAERSQAIRTVSAQGLITLTRENGDTVRLDAAIVLQPPQRARLRAWKFAQAVFDMTLTPEGLWLIAPREGEHRDEVRAAGANTGKLTRQWLGLMTGGLNAPGMVVEEAGPWLVVRQKQSAGAIMVCEIDRKTLTARRYVLKDAKGVQRFRLELDRYIEAGGVVWPRKIEAASESGRILIELREVEINGEAPPSAFRPPARAEKISEKIAETQP